MMDVSEKPGQPQSAANNAATNVGDNGHQVFHKIVIGQVMNSVNIPMQSCKATGLANPSPAQYSRREFARPLAWQTMAPV
ncbi:MAG: hypothetical protein WBC71_14245, partial [Salaquimonas sp.]